MEQQRRQYHSLCGDGRLHAMVEDFLAPILGVADTTPADNGELPAVAAEEPEEPAAEELH